MRVTEGAHVVELSGRAYVFSSLEKLIGEIPGWQVWEFTHRRSGGWLNLKIFDRREGVRRPVKARVFLTAYSPEKGRMARSKDWARLCDVYPDVASQLEEVIKAAF